jgi:cell division transport system permease protein
MRWLKEVLMNLRRSRFMSLISIGTIVLTVITLGGYFIISEGLNYTINKIQQKVEIVAFLKDGLNQTAVDSILNDVKGFAGIEDVKIVSKDQAYQDFMQDPEMQHIMKGFDGNPLPDSVVIKLKDYTRENINKTVRYLDTKEGIEDIQYGGGEIENLINIMNAVKMILGIAGMIFLISSILVVSNIIKLTIYARRQDIYVFKMVGASQSYIRMPFIMEGIIHGLIGGAIGWVLIYAVVNVMINEIRKQTGVDLSTFYLFTPEYFNVKFMLSMLGAGTGLGFIGALFSQGRLFR